MLILTEKYTILYFTLHVYYIRHIIDSKVRAGFALVICKVILQMTLTMTISRNVIMVIMKMMMMMVNIIIIIIIVDYFLFARLSRLSNK